MKKYISTHNGIFHSDEITAIALLELFSDDEIVVKRVEHNTKDFSEFDMVIDIGQKFDGVKFFDHHQYSGGKSSAGLIWDYLEVAKEYPKISKLIKLVDANDTGVKKAEPFEYSSLIRCFNSDDINSPKQDEAFRDAVLFAKRILKSLKDAQDEIYEAKEIVANSYLFNANSSSILELEKFTKHWSSYINGDKTPHIKAVVWQDEADGSYKIKISPKKVGSFELNARRLPQDESMEFVHSAGFFAVAKDRETMSKYLKGKI
ncbi:MYG1 family protein [Sulfurimonas hydrogeniphila]|uniref:MYG1 family protein n=1 Tax=Sulfurimonas hydrogeniphila TaxID=2509341 RepID=UPI00165FA003|nr:MYG1 family protein [Sulfurimonas hydrogeniphila]